MVNSESRNQTQELGRTLARFLRPGDIICLSGELGAGKTVLVKGIASGLGIKANSVISPTFVLLRELKGEKFPLYHLDLYRIKGEEELLSLGYEEYLYSQAITVIEWAERLGSLYPEDYLKVKLFSTGKNSRRIDFSAHGRRYKELLKGFYESIGG